MSVSSTPGREKTTHPINSSAYSGEAEICVTRLRRDEAGITRPTFGVVPLLVLALRVSTEILVFVGGLRGPEEAQKLQFEAIRQSFNPEEKKVIESVQESILVKNDAKRWMAKEELMRRGI